jgi:hypothetical protein
MYTFIYTLLTECVFCTVARGRINPRFQVEMEPYVCISVGKMTLETLLCHILEDSNHYRRRRYIPGSQTGHLIFILTNNCTCTCSC